MFSSSLSLEDLQYMALTRLFTVPWFVWNTTIPKNELRGFSPQANYTDRATHTFFISRLCFFLPVYQMCLSISLSLHLSVYELFCNVYS